MNPSRETKFSGANGDRKIRLIFPVQLTASKTGNLINRLIYTLAIGVAKHTYIALHNIIELQYWLY